MGFSSTAGVLNPASNPGGQGLSFQAGPLPAGNTFAFCEDQTEQLLELAQSRGCTTGLVLIDDRSFATMRAFQFVCRGDRDRVVGVIGALTIGALEAVSQPPGS